MSIKIDPVLSKRNSSKLPQKAVEERCSIHLKKIKEAFSKRELNLLAWETKFVKRASSKLCGRDFLVTLLVASLDTAHTSLEKMSCILTKVNRNVSITAQSIMARINTPEAVQFCMKAHESILGQRLSPITKRIPSHLLQWLNGVYIQDSTVIELHESLQENFKGSGGRSSPSAAKIDAIYEVLEQRYVKFTITDQRKADSVLAPAIDDILAENSLIIRDLGYLQIDQLETIHKKSAYFLSRLKSGFKIFFDPNQQVPVDVADLFTSEDNLIDVPIYITESKFPVRLIAYKAPQHVVDTRRRLAQATAKKQGRTLGKKALKMMEFTVFITNVPPVKWPPEVVGTIYAIRWQIELIFKTWKSGMGFHYLKGTNPCRIISLIHVRLLLYIIINKIYNLARSLTETTGYVVSMYKVFTWMRDSNMLIQILKGSLKRWIKRSFLKIVLKCMCQQKRKRKTTLQAIQEGMSYGDYCA